MLTMLQPLYAPRSTLIAYPAGILTLRSNFAGLSDVRALVREISRNRILATGMVFLIMSFLLALLSIYPEHHTYLRNTSEDIPQGIWTVNLYPPSFPIENLRISESYLNVASNVNLTVNVYGNGMLLANLSLPSNHERMVDLGGKTSVIILNGTSVGIGKITLSYRVRGFMLPWNVLGIPAAVLAIFGVVLAFRGYLSSIAKLKKSKV